jgi:hypothetical protein
MSPSGTSIHKILPPYDEKRRFKEGDVPVVGQLVRTVVPNLCDVWKVFDAQRADQIKHTSASGVIRSVDAQVDYRPKANRLPIFTLRLGDSEELLAIKSKLRLCLVLMESVGIPEQHLPNDWQRAKGREAFRYASYLVAPVFSTSTNDERRAFGPAMAARIECLVYPQFLYLPRTGGIISNDSVVRLDRAFWTTLAPPSVPEQMFLSSARLGALQSQLHILQGLPADPDYLEMASILQLELKSEHQISAP